MKFNYLKYYGVDNEVNDELREAYANGADDILQLIYALSNMPKSDIEKRFGITLSENYTIEEVIKKIRTRPYLFIIGVIRDYENDQNKGADK